MKERPAVRIILVLCLILVAAIASAAAQDDRNPAAGTGWLGVLLGDVRQAETPELDENPGVRVRRVLEDGPAMKAGFRAGDIIKEVDGTLVNSAGELIQAISGLDSGAWISMKIDRRGKSRELRARLDGRPEQTAGLNYRQGTIGIQTINLPETLRTHFGAPEGSGVMVSQIDDASPAQVSGLELGDLVFEVDGEPVRSSGHLRELLGSGGVGNDLEIKVMRDGLEIVVEAEVVDAPEDTRDKLIRKDRTLQNRQRRNSRE